MVPRTHQVDLRNVIANDKSKESLQQRIIVSKYALTEAKFNSKFLLITRVLKFKRGAGSAADGWSVFVNHLIGGPKIL